MPFLFEQDCSKQFWQVPCVKQVCIIKRYAMLPIKNLFLCNSFPCVSNHGTGVKHNESWHGLYCTAEHSIWSKVELVILTRLPHCFVLFWTQLAWPRVQRGGCFKFWKGLRGTSKGPWSAKISQALAAKYPEKLYKQLCSKTKKTYFQYFWSIKRLGRGFELLGQGFLSAAEERIITAEKRAQKWFETVEKKIGIGPFSWHTKTEVAPKV